MTPEILRRVLIKLLLMRSNRNFGFCKIPLTAKSAIEVVMLFIGSDFVQSWQSAKDLSLHSVNPYKLIFSELRKQRILRCS